MKQAEALRDMLVAAGVEQTFATFERAYRAVRGAKLCNGMPPPDRVQVDLWASRQAIIKLGVHERMWRRGREIDVEIIRKRDGVQP